MDFGRLSASASILRNSGAPDVCGGFRSIGYCFCGIPRAKVKYFQIFFKRGLSAYLFLSIKAKEVFMKTKILIFFLAFFSMLQLQAINIATPISSGAWRSVAWLNLLPNCAYPDNSEFVSYNINLSKDLTLSGAVEVNGLDISADDLSFSVLNGGDLTVENRINANNHNFSINLFSGGKLSCKDFEGFNAYEGRKFSMNFLGGEFVCEGPGVGFAIRRA